MKQTSAGMENATAVAGFSPFIVTWPIHRTGDMALPGAWLEVALQDRPGLRLSSLRSLLARSDESLAQIAGCDRPDRVLGKPGRKPPASSIDGDRSVQE
jgi:hypothetical protein